MDKEDKIQELSYECFESKENILKMLESLQQSFQSQKIILRDKKEMIVSPQGLITTSLVIKSHSGKNKVTMQFKWKETSE